MPSPATLHHAQVRADVRAEARLDSPAVPTAKELRRAVVRRGFDALNGIVRPLVRRGVGAPRALGLGAVIVETTGRRSGRPRRVPLLAARAGDTVVVSTIRGGSHWVRNAEETPRVKVWLDGRRHGGVADVRRLPGVDYAVIRLDGPPEPQPLSA